jgi:hypothetical protein
MIKVNVCWPALSRLNDAYQGRGRKQPGLTKGRGINKLRFRLVQGTDGAYLYSYQEYVMLCKDMI